MWKNIPEPVQLSRSSQSEPETPRIRPIGRTAGRPPAPRRRPVRRSRSSAWQSTALFSLLLLLVAAIGLAFYTFQRAVDLERELIDTRRQIQAGMQELRAGMQYDSIRQRLLLGMRDEILRVNGKLSLGEAYRYAEVLLITTDKYPSVDPLLMVAIGIVESGYDTRAQSPQNARGLYQIWPATGRMLAGMLDWEYEDEMLFDCDRNTEMAALYLDVLLTTYNDLAMVLAEYNGGPINAGYYRAGSHKTASETMDYVPKVLEQYQRLVEEMPMAPGRSFDIVYRDAKRSAKRLVPRKQIDRPLDVADVGDPGLLARWVGLVGHPKARGRALTSQRSTPRTSRSSSDSGAHCVQTKFARDAPTGSSGTRPIGPDVERGESALGKSSLPSPSKD